MSEPGFVVRAEDQHAWAEGLADAHAGRVVPAEQIAADLAARRATGR